MFQRIFNLYFAYITNIIKQLAFNNPPLYNINILKKNKCRNIPNVNNHVDL